MEIYYTIFIVTLFIQFIPEDIVSYKWKLVLTFIPLLIFGCLRCDFGNDYAVYKATYERIQIVTNIFSVDKRLEFGYMLLNKTMPSFRALLILTTSLTCVAFWFIFYRYIPSRYSWFGIALLFLSGDISVFFMLSGIRNSIAISLLLLSTYFIEKRKPFFYFSIMLLASTFHTSAFLFFPITYLFGSVKPFTYRSFVIWASVLAFLIIIPLDRIIDGVMPFVSHNFDRYSTYVDKANKIGDTRSLLILSSVIIMGFSNLLFLKNTELKKRELMMNRLALLFIYSYLLGSLNMRCSQYLILFFIVGSCNLLSRYENKNLRYFYTVFILLFLGYAFFVVWQGNPNFPYKVYHSIL